MGSSWSCPDGYDKLSEDLYKASLRLCVKSNTINTNMLNTTTGLYYPYNATFISHITSDAESVKLTFITLLFLIVVSFLLFN